jgi:hypothetical protein
MAQTIGEEIWEDGWRHGFAEGQLRASRQMLLRVLTQRFGTLPEAVVQRIESANMDRLEAAALQVFCIARPEDLPL